MTGRRSGRGRSTMDAKLGTYPDEFCVPPRMGVVTGDTLSQRIAAGYNPRKNAGLTDRVIYTTLW